MNTVKIIIITILVTSFVNWIMFKVYPFFKGIVKNEEGRLCRTLNSKEAIYCWNVLDNVFYNIYHDNSPYTREVCYSTYKWLISLFTYGIPLFANIYYLEKNTPMRFKEEYIKKQQLQAKQEKKENKKAPCHYEVFTDGRLYKRLKYNNSLIEVSEDEFLENAYQEDIEKYLSIKANQERKEEYDPIVSPGEPIEDKPKRKRGRPRKEASTPSPIA